jgi:hypothetical protein
MHDGCGQGAEEKRRGEWAERVVELSLARKKPSRLTVSDSALCFMFSSPHAFVKPTSTHGLMITSPRGPFSPSAIPSSRSQRTRARAR